MTMQNIYFPVQHINKPVVYTPGLCYFYFALIEDVSLWPAVNPQTGTFTDPVMLKEGGTWYRCETVDPDRAYKETGKVDTPGPYCEVSLSGFLPDDSPINSLTFSAMMFPRFVIVLKERNNIMRLLGSRDAGASFNRLYESQDAEGRRGTTLQFTWRSPLLPRLYLTEASPSGEIVSPPWITKPDIEFIVGMPGGPASGTFQYKNTALAGRIVRLFRSNGSKKTVMGFLHGDGYSQPSPAGVINVTPAWEPGEIVSIEIVK